MTHRLLIISIILLACLASQDLCAQRVIRELESNADLSKLNQDSTTNEKKEKKFVPVDVIAWTINPIFGTREPVDVDTLQHGFQRQAYSEGPFGEYNSLGNLGSPRETRIYMERESGHNFPFITHLGQFMDSQSDFKYYNTKSPYVNMTYEWCGTKTTGFDNFKAIYTNNAGKRLNFGGIFHYMYGQGYYDNQHTAYFKGAGWGSYVSDNYDLHLNYIHNDMKMEENGGITDENYITNPESMARSFSSDEIPTNLSKTWSRQHHDILNLNHRYHLGFTKSVEVDSATTNEIFTPVTSVFHQFELGSYRRRLLSYDDYSNYYAHSYLPGDTANNRYKMFEMSNRVGITLHEGFNKYAVAGLSAYLGFINRTSEIPDTIAGAPSTTLSKARYKESNVVIGGRIVRSQGTYVHYNAEGEIVVAGDDVGTFDITGHGELNVPVLGDTAQLSVDALISSQYASTILQNFHSKYYWWNKDLDKEGHMKVSGTLSYTKTQTALTFGVENVTNYTYLQDNGPAVTDEAGTTTYPHSLELLQEGSVQVLTARLEQKFKLGPANFEGRVTWQKSTKEDVLPLPTLSAYANLYFKFVLAKVLKVELGADMKYFSKYYSPSYAPAVSQFVVQNSLTREKVGGYPLVSVYANLALKKLRFHITYYHINQGDGRYFTMPNYPMNPKGLRFGISWNFYD